MRILPLLVVVAAMGPSHGCSDEEIKNDGSTNISDASDGGTDALSPDQLGPDTTADAAGPIPDPPAHSGVVYVGHFVTKELRIYRIDGSNPKQEAVFDLGKVTHDLQLDPFNDLLFVVSDVGKTIDILRLSRPASKSQKVALPKKIATITTASDKRPMFALINPHRHRLYVVVAPDTAGLVTEYELFAYDVTVPETPKPLSGSPYMIPVTTAMTLDTQRDLFFAISQKEKLLHGYSLAGDAFTALAGDPLDLNKLYPQQNNFGFQARSLTTDPYRRRMYAARSQGELSELLAFDYPEKVSAMSDIKSLADPFDVDQPSTQRPHLNDAFVPALDLNSGAIFLSAGVYETMNTYAMMTAIDSDLKLRDGCADFEGFGCWYASYLDGAPSVKVKTDGAACVDPTHKIAVGTAIAGNEADPGAVLFWRYTDALTMEPFLSDSGSLLAAGGLPVAVVCH